MEQSNCCGETEWMETGLCSQCKEHADFYDWEDSEKRIDVIGQNGNSGLHYTKEKIKELWDSINIIKR